MLRKSLKKQIFEKSDELFEKRRQRHTQKEIFLTLYFVCFNVFTLCAFKFNHFGPSVMIIFDVLYVLIILSFFILFLQYMQERSRILEEQIEHVISQIQENPYSIV